MNWELMVIPGISGFTSRLEDFLIVHRFFSYFQACAFLDRATLPWPGHRYS
jgi:hypothetical protein